MTIEASAKQTYPLRIGHMTTGDVTPTEAERVARADVEREARIIRAAQCGMCPASKMRDNPCGTCIEYAKHTVAEDVRELFRELARLRPGAGVQSLLGQLHNASAALTATEGKLAAAWLERDEEARKREASQEVSSEALLEVTKAHTQRDAARVVSAEAIKERD